MRILLLSCLLLLTACHRSLALPPPEPLVPLSDKQADVGRIVELASGKTLSPQQLLERLAPARRVLVGERHDHPDHHALQLWLLRELSRLRPQGSVLMEMLDPGQQAQVQQVQEQARAGHVPHDLYTALAWQAWWDWSQYGPLVVHQLRQPYPLLAANLERHEITRIYWERPVLQGRRSGAEQVKAKLLQIISESHCGLLPESQLPAMLGVQQQRDRRMAEALQAAPQPGLLLAGSYHVRKDLGVPLHLADLGEQDQGVVLILAESGRPLDATMADYVWYTAALPEQDHCVKLRP
ncbi:ChaN family lipoprotein [Pseudomonas sp. NCCP-436]|uniref:ChaN family lipoprotein n=1 Tax=Pseudomonas sp. NCCP-436 TaxID=2842481 RepID=UPI001C7EF297|nr:ChaN family lipoprotein [Pseudomonas sp. NCCP-436]GIZ12238.1 hypothetical protein NCCP436_16540 [Pseudomonas sp. NCCP-436]